MGVIVMRVVSVLAALAAIGLLPRPASAQENPLGDCPKTNEVTFTGPHELQPENKGGFYIANVRVVCDDSTLHADEVRWQGDKVTASGHVLLEQPGLRVTAERIEVDRVTKLGTFYEVTGWARIGDPAAEPNPFGQLEPDVQFAAERVERVGARVYRLTKGWYSSCAQPVPRWAITHSSGTIVLNERLIAKNAVLRVKGVPVFYMPYIYYPLGSDERSTGFLMPQYTATTARGSEISNAFFWAMGRSQDMTFFHSWASKAGQSFGTEYRYASAPGSGGNMQFTVLDQVSEDTRRRYLAKGSVNQRIGRYMNAVGRVNYTSDQLTQQLYNQNLYDASNRERYGGFTLTGYRGRYVFSATGELRDRYQGISFEQRQGLAPLASLNIGETPIGRSRVYFGMTNEAVSFIRTGEFGNPNADRSLFRVDAYPTIRAPLSRLPFLSLTTSAALRLTYWSKSQYDATEGVARPVGGPLTRQLVDLRAELVGPTFEKVWTPKSTGYADKFKHIIQPRVGVSWLSAYDRASEIVSIDWIDTQVSGNTSITYGLMNRWQARRPQPGGGGNTRSILEVNISQSYYTDALAAAFDPQYQSTTPSPYSPVQITANAMPADGFNARFQMYVDSVVWRPGQYSASSSFFMGRTQVGAGWSKRLYLPGSRNYNSEFGASHFLNWALITGTPGGRVNATYSANLDLRQASILQQRLVLSLNAQCCGVTFDYQILQAAQVGAATLAADRRFGVSFSLAGLGSFSNPFGSFGDNSGRR